MPPKILAVRHGQSAFNVERAAYASDEAGNKAGLFLPDCDITELGVEQSRQAGQNLLKQIATAKKVHFAVSPLRRALQTAQNMLEGISEIVHWKPTSLVGQPLAAEVMLASCDIGTPVNHLEKNFPHFDFSLVKQASNHNGYWWAYHRSVEETWKRMRQGEVESGADTLKRMEALKDYLRDDKACQDADVVVLVCHSETIWWLTSKIGIDGDRCGIYTDNGEILDITDHTLP